MMRPNAHRGPCADCGQQVGVGRGVVVGRSGGKWTIRHRYGTCPLTGANREHYEHLFTVADCDIDGAVALLLAEVPGGIVAKARAEIEMRRTLGFDYGDALARIRVEVAP